MALILAAAVSVALIVALVLWATDRHDRDRVISDLLRARFLVTLKTGETFNGLLSDSDARSLVLVDATSLAADREPLPVDGCLIVARDDVAYIQRP